MRAKRVEDRLRLLAAAATGQRIGLPERERDLPRRARLEREQPPEDAGQRLELAAVLGEIRHVEQQQRLVGRGRRGLLEIAPGSLQVDGPAQGVDHPRLMAAEGRDLHGIAGEHGIEAAGRGRLVEHRGRARQIRLRGQARQVEEVGALATGVGCGVGEEAPEPEKGAPVALGKCDPLAGEQRRDVTRDQGDRPLVSVAGPGAIAGAILEDLSFFDIEIGPFDMRSGEADLGVDELDQVGPEAAAVEHAADGPEVRTVRGITLQGAAVGLDRAGLVAEMPLGELAELVGEQRGAGTIGLGLELRAQSIGTPAPVIGACFGESRLEDGRARFRRHAGVAKAEPLLDYPTVTVKRKQRLFPCNVGRRARARFRTACLKASKSPSPAA